jgi:N-acetylglucosaminyldiphosphoundecaprenol N-acetyl-beta-D-mannosaminyltransferase
MSEKTVYIDELKFNLSGTKDVIETLSVMLSEGVKETVYYINVHVFNLLKKHKDIIPVFNSGYIVNDGMGIYLMVKLLAGKSKVGKSVSTDIWNGLLKICSENKLSVAVYGGEKDKESNLKNYLKSNYPGINLITYCDGYSKFELGELTKVDVLFIGTGSFKQELFANSVSDNEDITLKICVGSAIDYWTGSKKRAPLWMQIIGLEWLYRLFQEPGRLWKRYILGIPVFLFYVLVQKVKFILKK